MKKWKNYLDENGLVVQRGGDGGDSLNRTSVVRFLAQILGDMDLMDKVGAVARLSNAYGKYRRSNHEGKWYSEYDRTSRDQLTPVLIYLGYISAGPYPAFNMLFFDHLKRGLLFTYNTRRNFQYPTLEEHLAKSTPDVKWNYGWKIPDVTGPEFWALYIRGFRAWYLYPLLYFFDLETLIASVITRFQKQKDDVINHAVVLEYAKVRMDTFVMKLARMITPRPLLQSRLDAFFGMDQEPPINELYKQLR